MKHSLALCLVLLSSLLSGCATTLNCTVAHSVPYGGVQADANMLTQARKDPSLVTLGLGLAAAVDAPLSIAADTVTAPFILTGLIEGSGH